MAQLTADDVVLKAFQTTKFREGYDQVEVDDFLDEVAVSMRALATENEELKTQLAAAEARIAELERSGHNASDAPVSLPSPAPVGDLGNPSSPPLPHFGAPVGVPGGPLAAPGPDTSAGVPPNPVAPGAPVPTAPPGPVGGPVGGPIGSGPIGGPVIGSSAGSAGLPEDPQNDAETATGILAMANKLHAEYVRDGQKQGDQMISEAKAQAASIVREAEETATRTKSRLEQEKAELEKEIESLRIFERDYRTRLRTYLKNLLTDIDGAASPGGVDALGER
jgi:DivIVA domain-containing protein